MTDPSTLDPDAARAAIEYCYQEGWTDGLPIVPPTEDIVQQFIECGGRDPEEVLGTMEHLGRACTVEQAAINAVMAGCLPEYFPIVVATMHALRGEGGRFRGGSASTQGPAPFIVVNGPIRNQLGINSTGNIFGPGFRANATIGRAIRLIIQNVFGMLPHELDQATQGTPAKYTFCIGENEEESPWEPLHVEKGFAPESNAVTVYTARSNVHVENRQSADPEQVLLTIADAMSYLGSTIYLSEANSTAVVIGPEHAQLMARAGWSKADVKQFLWEHHGRTLGDLRLVGKAETTQGPDDTFFHFSVSPNNILVVVAGANNAGVSTVIPAFGPWSEPADVTVPISVPEASHR